MARNRLRGTLKLAAFGLAAMGLVAMAPSSIARAQDAESPAAIAERVHRAGGYPDDIVVLPPEGEADLEGAGQGPRGETAIDRSREAVANPPAPAGWMRDLIEWFEGLMGSLGGPLAYLLLAIGLALLTLLVVFFAASIRLRVPAIAARERDEATGDAAIDPLLVRGGESADALAAEGRYREAIHALFLDALARIGGREGRLRGRTARELVGAVNPERVGRRELGALLDLTELVWFGGRPASEAQYLEARALIDAVPAAAPGDEAIASGGEPA